jgi:hypothetical protein
MCFCSCCCSSLGYGNLHTFSSCTSSSSIGYGNVQTFSSCSSSLGYGNVHTCSCPCSSSSSSSIGYVNVCAMKYGEKPIHLKGEKQNRHQLFIKNRGDGKKFIQFTYLISSLALFCDEETMK